MPTGECVGWDADEPKGSSPKGSLATGSPAGDPTMG